MNHLRKIQIIPSILDKCIIHLIFLIKYIRKTADYKLEARNFLHANSLSTKTNDLYLIEKSLHILIPFIEKDLECLEFCISGALHSTSNFVHRKITLISNQEYDVSNLTSQIQNVEINFLTDEDVLGINFIRTIQGYTRKRSGWIIQQLVKLFFASNVTEDLVLVIDSDTILLRAKTWVDKSGKCLIYESEEFNLSYFKILVDLGLDIASRNSHVTHHILYTPRLVRELLTKLSKPHPRDWKSFFENFDSLDGSLVSLDYEMYAQFVLFNYPELFSLQKWSNISLQRQEIRSFQSLKELQSKFVNYNSVSFHDWFIK